MANNVEVKQGLQVEGPSDFAGDIYASGDFQFEVNGAESFSVYNDLLTANLFEVSTDSVKIGTSAGAYSIDMQTSPITGLLRLTASDALTLTTNANTTPRIYIASDGKVGINNNNPAFNLDITGDSNFRDSLTIQGDLIVNGTTTSVNVENLEIADNLLVINDGEAGAGVTAGIAGIEIDRGTETNYQIIFDESQDHFRVGEIGFLQAVATREDSPNATSIPFWNDTNKRFDTSSILKWDGSELFVNRVGIQEGDDATESMLKYQIALTYGNNNYSHFITTSHSGSDFSESAIRFYLNDTTSGGVYPTNAVHTLTISGDGVGIGEKTPSDKLHINGGNLRIEGGTPIIYLQNTDAPAGTASIINWQKNLIFKNGDGDERLKIQADDKIVMNEDGAYVGMGVSSPSYMLHVIGHETVAGNAEVAYFSKTVSGGAGTAFISVAAGGQSLQLEQNSGSAGPFRYGGYGNSNIINARTDSLSRINFVTNSAVRMTLNNTGSVGIGTDSPIDRLHIAHDTTDARVIIDGAAGYDAELKFLEDGSAKYTIGYNQSDGNFVLGTTNVDTNPLVVVNSSTERVGINTTTPNATLQIVGGDARIDINRSFGHASNQAYIPDAENLTAGGVNNSLLLSDNAIYVVYNANNTSGAGIIFGQGTNDPGDVNWIPEMIIKDGEVGINTVTPDGALDVEGSGASYLTAPNTAPIDANFSNSQYTIGLDEGSDEFELKARKSDGTYINQTIGSMTGTVAAYREEYVVGTAKDNYTGSATTFDLASNYETNEKVMKVYVDGVLMDPGVSDDYVETSDTRITFNYSLNTGQKVHFLWGRVEAANTASILKDADSDTMVQVEESNDEDYIRFDTAGTERMNITSVGFINMYPGNGQQVRILSDSTTDSVLTLETPGGTDTNRAFLRLDTHSVDWSVGTDSDDHFHIAQAGNMSTNRYLTVTTGGNVGIGTSSPGVKLEVEDGVNSSHSIRIRNTTDGTSAYASLQVYGGTDGNDTELIDFAQSYSTSSGRAGWGELLSRGNGVIISANNASGQIKFRTGGNTDRIFIDSSGNLIPASDNTYNIGASGTRWANVYATNVTTGDLHMKNDKGDWTLQEEEDRIIVINNKSGKKFKMLLEEIN